MAVNIANAAAAYAKRAGTGLEPGATPRSADPGQSFSELLADSVKGAIDVGRQSEAMSAKALAGKADLNEVVTAVTVARGDWRESRRVTSTVTFCRLPEEVIRAYCDTPEPYDKAGAYGIQGFGGSFVMSLSGSYSAVMGLPLYETTELLALAGIHPGWKEGLCNE